MKQLLAFLLHHANREYKSEKFYAIKNMLLKKYGNHIGYDVQYIEGKKCYSCGATGYYSHWRGLVECFKCDGTGFYKLPVYNILEVVQFGKYRFHQPYKRAYAKPELPVTINDYISHTSTKYGKISRHILFLIYESGYLKRYYRELNSWYCSWWMPKNWLHNAIYIHKYGLPNTTFRRVRTWWNNSGYVPDVVYDYDFFVGRKNAEIEDCDILPF